MNISNCHFYEQNLRDSLLVWARRAGGDDLIKSNDLAPLPDESVAITGDLSGTTVFGRGEPNEISLTLSKDENDMFVAKFGP